MNSIGVDIGGTNLRAALVTVDGQILKKIKISSSGDILAGLIDTISSLYSEDVAGIGLAIAGIVDKKQGGMSVSPNIPSIAGVNIISKLQERFQRPIEFGNDASLAALGEGVSGAGKGLNTFVMFTLGTGIGGGVVYNGSLLEAATELGHITIETQGIKCSCGNNGCLEAYASAGSIVKRAVKHGLLNVTPEDIYRNAKDGDSISIEILKDAGRYLGIGMANMINIFSPEAVIIGGGIAGAWDIMVKEAIIETQKRCFKELFDGIKIVPAVLGDDAGLIGAAHLVNRGIL
ncbi:MAG: ROK family protein [Nitrospirae bacterium]|nr:ROK family protein [Nitrospirota bacterium]MBF0540802.1 ROK family protein [Nitrospirota bacterium]